MKRAILSLLTAFLFVSRAEAACSDNLLVSGYAALSVGMSKTDVAGKLSCTGKAGEAKSDRYGRSLLDVTYEGRDVTVLVTYLNSFVKEMAIVRQPIASSTADGVSVWYPATQILVLPVVSLSDPAKGVISYRASVSYQLADTGVWSKISEREYDPLLDGQITAATPLPSMDLKSGQLSLPQLVADGRAHGLTTLRLDTGGTWDVLAGDGLIPPPLSRIAPADVTPVWDAAKRQLRLPMLALTDSAAGFKSPVYFTRVIATLSDNGFWLVNAANDYQPLRDGTLAKYPAIAAYDSRNQWLAVPAFAIANGGQAATGRNLMLILQADGRWATLQGVDADVPGSTLMDGALGRLLHSGVARHYAGVRRGTVITLLDDRAYQITGECSIPSSEDSVPKTPLVAAVGNPGEPGYKPAVDAPPRIPPMPLISVYDTGLGQLILTIQGDPSSCAARQIAG